MGGKFQRTRSSTTHGAVPIAGLVETVQLIIRLQFLALLSSRPTRISKLLADAERTAALLATN